MGPGRAALAAHGRSTFLSDQLDMVIVVTADPLHGQHGYEAGRKEKTIPNLVGEFVESLPSE